MRGKRKKPLSDKQKLRQFLHQTLESERTAVPCCRHFGQCGGCEFQDVEYDSQVAAKGRALQFVLEAVTAEMIEKAAASDDPETALSWTERSTALSVLNRVSVSLESSPAPFGYRQRMDYVFAFGKAGLRVANRHRQVVDLEECPLLGPAGFNVMHQARKMAETAGLESYDYMRHTGELRYFVVRQSRDGQFLLSLVTKTRDRGTEVMGILQRMVDKGDITSGHWLVAEGLGDVSFGPSFGYSGQPAINETMNDIPLYIGPNTFFQSNPSVAEKAYAAIRDFTPAGSIVMDLYSGVGSIAQTVAAKASMVLAVENIPDNIHLAKENLFRSPHAERVHLVLEDSSTLTGRLAVGDPGLIHFSRPDMVVVNPPRPGVGDAGILDIRRIAPERIAYLSCNPFTLFRDSSLLLTDYTARSLTLYDMFPQTRHFETLMLLERR